MYLTNYTPKPKVHFDVKKYAVIGNPIDHSRSPQIHLQFAAQFDLKIEYLKLTAEKHSFEVIVKEFQQQGGLGMNVTIPFKQMAVELCDSLSDCARHAGAVNTLSFQSDGKIHGDNTDGFGLIQDLSKNHHCQLKDKHILIFGAGGAVCGILPALLQERPKSITITNRTSSKAQDLARKFKVDTCAMGNILAQKFDVVINGSSDLVLPQLEFKPGVFAYDINYTGSKLWPKHIKQADGYGMLVEQAAQSFYLWHGLHPKT